MFGESRRGEVKADFKMFPLADDDDPAFGVVPFVLLLLLLPPVELAFSDEDDDDEDDPGEPANVVAGGELEMADESDEFDNESTDELKLRPSCC